MKEENRLAKFLDGSFSDEAKAQWDQDPDKELYERIKHYSADLATPQDADDAQLLQEIMDTKATKVTKLSPYRYSHWLAVAGILLCIVMGGWFMWSLSTVLEAPAQASLQVKLPDGSAVLLKKGSKIRHKRFAWPLQRHVQLLGDAYFDVEKGQTFTVETSLGSVRVLGTRFDVLTRGGKLSVHCYHGKVEVQRNQEKMILTQGQSLLINAGRWERDSVFVQEPAWKASQLLFQSASLEQVIAEVERSFAIALEIAPHTQKGAKQFTGKLPTGEREAALQIIEKAFSVNCLKLTDNRYLIEAR